MGTFAVIPENFVVNKWWTTVLHKSNRLQIGRTYLLIDILLFFSIRKSVPTLNAYVYGQRCFTKEIYGDASRRGDPSSTESGCFDCNVA